MVLCVSCIFVFRNLILSYPIIEIVVFLQKEQTIIYSVHPCVCDPTLPGGLVVAGVKGSSESR